MGSNTLAGTRPESILNLSYNKAEGKIRHDAAILGWEGGGEDLGDSQNSVGLFVLCRHSRENGNPGQ